jgi:hypothetical protein
MFCVILALVSATRGTAQNAYQDRAVASDAPTWDCLDKAMRPYIAQARRTFPAARARFVKHLTPNSDLFLTTRLKDSSGRIEQVFVKIDSISGDTAFGRIASDVALLNGIRNGSQYRLRESQIIDWTIVSSEGREEGNFVGKFLGSLQARLQESDVDKPC